jgi:broad specificity phosphatase PhoE
MQNTFYFLIHAETKPDTNQPISNWALSEKGITDSQALAKNHPFGFIDSIIISEERKAFQTLMLFRKDIMQPNLEQPEFTKYASLNELDRDPTGYLEKTPYEEAVKSALTSLGEPYKNDIGEWETAKNALTRFSKCIRDIDKETEDQRILVIGHAYTMNLYFARRLNELGNVYDRLQTNGPLDYGIVGKERATPGKHSVITDIAKTRG